MCRKTTGTHTHTHTACHQLWEGQRDTFALSSFTTVSHFVTVTFSEGVQEQEEEEERNVEVGKKE